MTNLLWIDLETTGTDPQHDLILEIGAVVTDWELRTVGQMSRVISHNPETVSTLCDPFVFQMHLTNGLLDEVKDSYIDLLEASHHVVEFAKEHKAIGGPCAGSTPQFDRAFLRAHGSPIDKLFNHRVLDVSSFKAWQSEHGVAFPPRKGVHRALPDIHESIELLRAMRGQVIA